MTSPVNSASAVLGAASASATSPNTVDSKQTLGQDAFLKLLMAQLSNQDPLQPTDGTQFVTQLSQFSMVEQSVQQSTQLGTIARELQALGGTVATALVGKLVTVENTNMRWDGTFATNASVSLAGPAQTVTAAVQDSSGDTVRTMTLGPQKAGALQIAWDGKEDSGQPAPAGTYAVVVSAADAAGRPVGVSQTVSGVVKQVSLDQGAPSVTLSNGAVAPLSQVLDVGAASGGATTNNAP